MNNPHVYCWGYNHLGQLNFSHEDASPIDDRVLKTPRKHKLVDKVGMVQLSLSFTAVVTEKSELLLFGQSFVHDHEWKDNIERPLGNIKVIRVGCGIEHCLAVDDQHVLFSWGSNTSGQCGVGNGHPIVKPTKVRFDGLKECKVLDVAAGYAHSLAIVQYADTNGNGKHVFSFGSNALGQLGNQLTNDSFIPQMVTFVSSTSLQVVQVACGWSHSLIRLANGSVYSFGWGSYLQLGHGDTDNRHVPTLIQHLSGKKIVDMACGGWHTVFLGDDGTAFSVGYGQFGQLGGEVSRKFPEPIQALVDAGVIVVKIACGSRHTVFLSKEGEIFTCGIAFNGSLGVATESNIFVPTRVELDSKDVHQVASGPLSWGTAAY